MMKIVSRPTKIVRVKRVAVMRKKSKMVEELFLCLTGEGPPYIERSGIPQDLGGTIDPPIVRGTIYFSTQPSDKEYIQPLCLTPS